jgi:hypothetical protein
MVSLGDFYGWFRTEANTLPQEVKIAVLESLALSDPRQLFLKLDDLQKAGKLPPHWDEVLNSFYSQFF